MLSIGRADVAEAILLLFGIYLILDSFFFHLISFDYPKVGLAWADPLINHWMVGVILILIVVASKYKRWRDLSRDLP